MPTGIEKGPAPTRRPSLSWEALVGALGEACSAYLLSSR
jgi:hypothetical protein